MQYSIFFALVLSTLLTCKATGDDWAPKTPRDELRPTFSTNGQGYLVISHDQRQALDGWYEKSFDIQGGKTYLFQVERKTQSVLRPRQSCLVRIVWEDANGKIVPIDVRPRGQSESLPMPSAEPEYPTDGTTSENGWTMVSGTYRSPSRAVRARVELHLQWAPNSNVQWRNARFAAVEPLPKRIVRLASVHYRPSGKSPMENCQEYAPLIANAARQRADLVVLGETITAVGLKKNLTELAEPIPGPTTKYFSGLAQEHRVHLVFSLNERDQHLIYNTAVLLGPDGKLIGKYRKVSLPPGEAENGTAPGNEFPVFETAIGKVGMMVCYDGFFPEVARQLTNNGAEIIAWPVWGCNPLLAQARACENHVYVVSSTFMAPKDSWMKSAIYDQSGEILAEAKEWGTVVTAEVDLNDPYIGPYNLGDFRSMLPRHRPAVTVEQ